jgi:N-formylglutamate deformylase
VEKVKRKPQYRRILNMDQFPVLLSIPHGGTKMPEELRGIACIDPVDLFDDSDAFTPEIYHLGDRVKALVCTDIARAFVDMNRSTNDLPPQNPDGVIKKITCYGKPIYFKGKEPGPVLIKSLINRYYLAYHRRIHEVILTRQVALALDCHSMAAEPPAVAPDVGSDEKRPLICLGNNDDKACEREITEKLAGCFCRAFSLNESDVTINKPFSGGYITRAYGMRPVPWVQVELNRSLYLAPPWFDRAGLRMDKTRLQELNRMFEHALELYFAGDLRPSGSR